MPIEIDIHKIVHPIFKPFCTWRAAFVNNTLNFSLLTNTRSIFAVLKLTNNSSFPAWADFSEGHCYGTDVTKPRFIPLQQLAKSEVNWSKLILCVNRCCCTGGYWNRNFLITISMTAWERKRKSDNVLFCIASSLKEPAFTSTSRIFWTGNSAWSSILQR